MVFLLTEIAFLPIKYKCKERTFSSLYTLPSKTEKTALWCLPAKSVHKKKLWSIKFSCKAVKSHRNKFLITSLDRINLLYKKQLFFLVSMWGLYKGIQTIMSLHFQWWIILLPLYDFNKNKKCFADYCSPRWPALGQSLDGRILISSKGEMIKLFSLHVHLYRK